MIKLNFIFAIISSILFGFHFVRAEWSFAAFNFIVMIINGLAVILNDKNNLKKKKG